MFQISKGDGGKDAEGDAAPSRDANVGLTAARMTAIRACIAGRWGTTVLRAAIDVAADFDGCTTPAENSGDVGDSNFALVLDGWAEPEDEDHSRMHRLVTGDQ